MYICTYVYIYNIYNIIYVMIDMDIEVITHE